MALSQQRRNQIFKSRHLEVNVTLQPINSKAFSDKTSYNSMAHKTVVLLALYGTWSFCKGPKPGTSTHGTRLGSFTTHRQSGNPAQNPIGSGAKSPDGQRLLAGWSG